MHNSKIKILFVALAVTCSFALAGHPTLAGTVITANQVSVAYTGGSVTINPYWETTVKVIRGYELIPTAPRTTSINVPQLVYFPHKIINRANVTDNVTWNILFIDANWSYVFIKDDNDDGVHQSEEVTTINTAITLASNATYNFFVKFSPILASTLFSGVNISSVTTNFSTFYSYNGFNSHKYGGYSSLDVSDNIDATDVRRTGIYLTAYLEGYYNYAAGTQQPITINVQFRTVQNINSGISFNIPLDTYGNALLKRTDIPTGDYYVCVRHYLPGLALGVNHLTYVSSINISLTKDVITTINVSDSAAPAFLPVYISYLTKINPMTELHGKFQIKGGDSNADDKVNVVDIVAWENQSKDSQADQRGELRWSEKANYNGDALISGADFSIWNKNKGQYVPPPEKDSGGPL